MTTKKTSGAAGGSRGKGGSAFSGRGVGVRVKTARSRKPSSTAWLQRQLNDPYVAEAKKRGYRSRAAFKLIELDDRFHLLKAGMRVVDLGAAPGGWTQISVERVKPGTGAAKVVGLDLLPMEPVPGATTFQADFLEPSAPERLRTEIGGGADLVLSDMAANTTGHAATDHLRIMGLAEAAYDFASEILAPGGAFVCKLFQGGAERDLLTRLRQDFRTVRHAKPPASRADSSETYVVAQGFRGRGAAETTDAGAGQTRPDHEV
ncbi:RlmE family RNA methyltransferase [Arenibaculum pallidiluteum]|uniref:RlmE family RNA methyltransferase n=1 Tax=Arenibaculum pallidiluteum TaxID=2812559 RepID=UPI001A95C5DF|nr:RlmE family RNA methyltransferase [Arenibaculum pallidiluteum]